MDTETHYFKVLIASADACAIKRWHGALDASMELHKASGWSQAWHMLRQLRPDLIVLDSDLLSHGRIQALTRLTVSAPESRVLLMGDAGQDTDRLAAIKAGVVGYCERDAESATVNKAVNAIRNGEVWLPRALISGLINEITDAPAFAMGQLTDEQRQWLSSLTARELEVARLVYQSANNKTIARELSISERTVKAHLSAIFRKLRVGNRVRLALLFKDLT